MMNEISYYCLLPVLVISVVTLAWLFLVEHAGWNSGRDD